MRHIPLLNQTPDPDWVAKADVLLAALKAAPDEAARKQIIEDNSGVWGELKTWLLSLSHGKCWFSEAKDCFCHWDVEHYRPKTSVRDLDGTKHDGYWWLAFDWHNYRICGNVGNGKKGTYFPLRSGCARIGLGGDLRYEDPMLLDPADSDDPNLLFFDLEGHAIVAPGVTDEWEKERVRYSVSRCNLDYHALVDKRRTVWAECWRRIQAYREELARYSLDRTNAIAQTQYKQAMKQLREMICVDRELSAVARACIESSGDPRCRALLRSA